MADTGAALKQMGSKAVAQAMQRHRLGDPSTDGGFMEQTAELPGRQVPAGPASWKQPTLFHRYAFVPVLRADPPPLPQ